MAESVSVIIPCHGQAAFLPRAIESCLTQRRRADEIIVVDDGSPDDVPGALRPYRSSVTLVSQTNRGLAAARNRGLAVARGALVKFLDADDWLLPDSLTVPASLLAACPASVFSVTGYRIVAEASGLAEDFLPYSGPLAAALCWQNPAPVHAYLFPAPLLRAVGGFDDSARFAGGHEDYELLTRLALTGAECFVWPRVGCVYWQNPGGMSRKTEAMNRTRLDVWLHYAEALLDRAPSGPLLAALLGGLAKMLQLRQMRFEGRDVLEALAHTLLTPPAADDRVRAQVGLFTATATAFLPQAAPPEADDRARMQQALDALQAAYPSGDAVEGFGHLRRETPLLFAASLLQRHAKMASRRAALAERRAAAAEHRSRVALECELTLQAVEARAATAVIFGTGVLARSLLERFRRVGIQVSAFLDSHPDAWNSSVDGVPVRSVAVGLETRPDLVVIGSLTYAGVMDQTLADVAARLGVSPRVLRP